MNSIKRTLLVRQSHCTAVLPLMAVLVCLWPALPSGAAMFTLEDLNSTAVVEYDSSSGMSSWLVDGKEVMARQWFWVRLGEDGPEQSIESIDPDGPQSIHSSDDFDPGKESLLLRYESAVLRIDLDLELIGGQPGSSQSHLEEFITVKNIGSEIVDVHLFQYVDIDLADGGSGDTVVMVNDNTVRHTGGTGAVSETVVALWPSHYELNTFSNTLAKLEDGLATTLSDAAGPVGPGNVTWAFQWDFPLTAEGSQTIRKYKQVQTPEPGTLGILIVGGLALLRRRQD